MSTELDLVIDTKYNLNIYHRATGGGTKIEQVLDGALQFSVHWFATSPLGRKGAYQEKETVSLPNYVYLENHTLSVSFT